MTKRQDPFDVALDEAATQALTQRLCDAIRIGLSARTKVMDDGGLIDFAYSLYEQQGSPTGAGLGSLTSPIGTQMVDTLTAIASKTVFVEPFLIVEGFGDDSKKAPAVEEHLQWRFEDMRGQSTAVLAIQEAFIEEGAVLEVCEDAVAIRKHEVVKAAVATNADGTYILDPKTTEPTAATDPETGALVPAPDGDEYVEVHRSYADTLRRGATLRLHSLKDFLFLPGHARDRRDVWGHALRFWMPLDELRVGEGDGEYKHIDRLGTNQERQQRTEQDRSGTTVDVDQGSDKVEKELWRVQFYADLDAKGLCFYVATVSLEHDTIVRLRHDWLGRWRQVYLNPYPRTYSVYGYSLLLHKLLTTIEGHTAFRNMNAYRATLKSNAPMKRLHGAQWDPAVQPLGAGEVIDVMSMNELEPLAFEDVTAHAFQREREFYEEAARIVGVSDILASVNPKVSRTLGENEMVTEQSFTRAENPIRNLQEGFEEVGELIHAIELKTLEDLEHGLEPPASVADNVRQRLGEGTTFDGRFTPQMLMGRYRFKPRGSVETADPNRRVNTFTNMLALMGLLAERNPDLARRYASPEVADALNQQFVELARIRDKQAFLKPLPPAPLPQGAGAPPGAPQGALPPGLPPMPPGLPPGDPTAPPPADPTAAPNFGGEQLVAQMLSQVPQ